MCPQHIRCWLDLPIYASQTTLNRVGKQGNHSEVAPGVQRLGFIAGPHGLKKYETARSMNHDWKFQNSQMPSGFSQHHLLKFCILNTRDTKLKLKQAVKYLQDPKDEIWHRNRSTNDIREFPGIVAKNSWPGNTSPHDLAFPPPLGFQAIATPPRWKENLRVGFMSHENCGLWVSSARTL